MENKSVQEYFSLKHIDILCRIVFGAILIHLVAAGFSNTLVHQMKSPVLKFPYVDPTFWIMHLLQIPDLISSNIFLSWVWDVMLFSSCIGVLVFPQKKWIIAIFILFYFAYYIIFNSYGTHHTHSLVAILIMPVVFLFPKKSFPYLWEALRYFLLFIYSAAFLWKLFRFSWLNMNQGILINKRNLTPYLYFNKDSILANIYSWFLNHPLLITFIFWTGFILEGLFIIGFFTKKYDRYLFISSLILPMGFWFISDAWFFEQLILSLTLLHFKTKKVK